MTDRSMAQRASSDVLRSAADVPPVYPCAISLPSPINDIGELNRRMGRAWGVTCGESIPQYLEWCERAGVFDVLASGATVSLSRLESATPLSAEGIDALVPILASLDLVQRDAVGGVRITSLAREYLLKTSPYYAGVGLYWDSDKPIPANYLREPDEARELPLRRWPAAVRNLVPHSRNFAPTVVAARCGEFDDRRHVVDIGGASGVFAIPLALDHPHLRITLVDLPDAFDGVREHLAAYGVQDRVDLVAMDAFRNAWSVDACDGVVFGNVFHANNDESCRFLAGRSAEVLSAGGKIWVHEVVFNERRDGPLQAALWNANAIVRSRNARQRSAAELTALLEHSGFVDCHARPTAGDFCLVTGSKPAQPHTTA